MALLGAVAATWGSSYLLIKIALEDLEPGMIVWARCLLGALFLSTVMTLTAGGRDARATRAVVAARPGRAVLHGVLATTLPFMLITFGELEVPSGLTAVLLAPASLFVALFAIRVDHSEKADARSGAGMLLGLAGVALLVGVESVHSLAAFAGALAILAASASYGGSSLFVKRAFAGVRPIVSSAISIGVTALLTTPLAIATWPDAAPGVDTLAAVAFLGIVGTALAFVAFYSLIGMVGASRASLVAYLAPAVALLYGGLFYDEPLTAAGIGGLALILGGVALASARRAPVAARR